MKVNKYRIMAEASFLGKLFDDMYCGREEFTVVNRVAVHNRVKAIIDEAKKIEEKNESK